MTTTYESVLEVIGSVPRAASAGHRDVKWITEANIVGIARDYEGRVEVFLVGGELKPSSSTVVSAIEFRTWHRDWAPSINASRLILPARGYFDQVAAFICTELLRSGADNSLKQAFGQTEPIIEMALEKLRLSDAAILGLAGELLLLDALCRQATDEQVMPVVESWDGWKKSSRDFSLGATGVEVKTTTRNNSSHPVEGTHQVERNDGLYGGSAEDRLLVVSIGLQPAEPQSNAFTIPQLVQRIIVRMEETGAGRSTVHKFVTHVSDYGANPGGGYKHGGDEVLDPAYCTPFLTSFFRAYDMSDPVIEVLRRDDVAVRHHVDNSSVRFRVELPLTASLGNPVVGANQVAQEILGTTE